MAKRSFVVSTEYEMDYVVEKVEEIILEGGGKFEGDTESGAFSGNTAIGFFAGKYSSRGQDITVEVVKKPLLVPMAVVEETVRKLFKEA